jgi:hypothetical protein
MDIREATRSFEAWLATHVELLRADLERKHEAMTGGAFPFLRATFYRYLQRWPELAGAAVTGAPRVLAVGDLHLANFGTWRDVEGRLIWGINDFDEAHAGPYTLDLARLATSALVTAGVGALRLGETEICAAILDGYRESLEAGGLPYVLAEEHGWLREAATASRKAPEEFWKKLEGCPSWSGPVPAEAERLLAAAMPEPGLQGKSLRRTAGLGSLGLQRVVRLATWRGARLAREAKALRPPAAVWVSGRATGALHGAAIARRARRAPDPWLRFGRRWVVRRLAPDSDRIEPADLPRQKDEARLLRAMGRETANVHLGKAGAAAALRRHLGSLPAQWLRDVARRGVEAVDEDARDWRKG